MYMARGDKKTAAEAAATPVEDRGTMPKAASAAQAAGFEDTRGMEGGIEPLGLRRNQETGDLYDPTGRVLGGGFTGRQRPVVSTPGGRVQSTAPVREDTTSLARETARAGRGPIAAMGHQNPQRGPAFSNLEEMRAVNAARENITDMARETARGRRGRIAAVGYQNPQRGPTAEELFEYRRGQATDGIKKGGAVKMASGGSVSSASRRGDGIAQRGKTKGRMR
jgi:hypothetical protein